MQGGCYMYMYSNFILYNGTFQMQLQLCCGLNVTYLQVEITCKQMLADEADYIVT